MDSLFSTDRSRSSKIRPMNKTSALSRSNTAEYGSLLWEFDCINHYLSEKLVKWVYHKWVLRIIAGALGLGLLISFTGQMLVATVYWLIVSVLLFIPWDLLLILSFNRDACGFIVRSTEFWIKIVYALAHSTLDLIVYHQVGRYTLYSDVPKFFGYGLHICGVFNLTLFMIIVGGTDAIPKLEYKWKVFGSAFTGFSWTLVALANQFGKEEDDYIIRIQATQSVLSFHSLRSNTAGMLAMFLWKQLIAVIRNRDRCISINYKPYLRWVTPMEELDVIHSVIHDTPEVAIETAD